MSRAKPVMVQGTMSNAGKSILCAALCRIFKEDGYRVAPFKSQNMALNSFITDEGLEMGRAQVVQAEAAGIAPKVVMNPVLLKPTTDVGSQVIVNGEVRGNMSAADYFKYKKQLIPDILKAYDSLASENDIIVIEGAGSPAEINLKSYDIVNMGLAKMVNAPVLLTGDIDRGGVFAQLYGTVALLEEDERNRIKATVINKFRGDRKILEPGLDMLYEKIHIPCAGVVPYMHLDIDDEDSLSERLHGSAVKSIDIAVIFLPRLSNFTDFTPFERFGDVSVRYVKNPAELKAPDLIILPGTKSTIADLKWLREIGLEAEILKCHSRGTPVFGICGGFQMLGNTVSDPYKTEGGGAINGLGLLPVDTVFSKEKTRSQTTGAFENLKGIFKDLNGLSCTGYEIHMGKNSNCNGSNDNSVCTEIPVVEDLCGTVYGTYIHGIFDGEGIADTIIRSLCKKKEIPFDVVRDKTMSINEYKEKQYSELARIVRSSLDMKMIYDILEAGT